MKMYLNTKETNYNRQVLQFMQSKLEICNIR